MKFCSNCGNKISFGSVPEDPTPRFHCDNCSVIHYQNPNMVVGCLPVFDGKVLLCKRAIDPRYGLWTLPAGFLEIGETVEAGALRETDEEANADVTLQRLFSVYSLPKVGQVYLIFLASLNNLDFYAGHESLEVRLFSIDEIPWTEIAFTAIKFSLEKYVSWDGSDDEVFMGEH